MTKAPSHKILLSGIALLAIFVISPPALADHGAPHGGDPCLVGTWQEIRGGADEKVIEMIFPNTHVSTRNAQLRMTLVSDGTYTTAPYGHSMDFVSRTSRRLGWRRGDSEVSDVIGYNNEGGQSSGRWSAARRRLLLVVERTSRAGETVVNLRDGSIIRVPVRPTTAAVELDMGYSCTETTLETRHDIAGFGTIETTYERVTETPRR